MLSGLWAIVEHYLLGFGVIAIGVALYVISVLLETQVDGLPVIGPWLGRNIKHVREWAIVIAVLGLSHTFVYGIGVKNGEARIKAEWTAANAAAVQRAVTARSSAERVVKRSPDGVRNDPYNRDK